MTISKALVAILFLTLALPISSVAAADSPSCGELPCRANGVPYVTQDGKIVIFQGESFWVELTIEGDRVVGLTPRKERELPNTILVELVERGGSSALLWGNQLDRPLLFHVTMTAPRRESLPMKGCPLPRKRYTYEVWPFEIHALEIGNFRFTPAEGAKCD